MASATVLGGFWPENGVNTYTFIGGLGGGRGPQWRKIAQALGKKSMMGHRAQLLALIGAAAGQAASKTLTRIANNTDLSGLRAVETETISTGNTTSDQETELETYLTNLSGQTYDPTPYANLDGNPLGTR